MKRLWPHSPYLFQLSLSLSLSVTKVTKRRKGREEREREKGREEREREKGRKRKETVAETVHRQDTKNSLVLSSSSSLSLFLSFSVCLSFLFLSETKTRTRVKKGGKTWQKMDKNKVLEREQDNFLTDFPSSSFSLSSFLYPSLSISLSFFSLSLSLCLSFFSLTFFFSLFISFFSLFLTFLSLSFQPSFLTLRKNCDCLNQSIRKIVSSHLLLAPMELFPLFLFPPSFSLSLPPSLSLFFVPLTLSFFLSLSLTLFQTTVSQETNSVTDLSFQWFESGCRFVQVIVIHVIIKRRKEREKYS